MSVVNSEMAESCCCQADHASDIIENVKIGSLWSVKITKFCLSKKYRECRTYKCINKSLRSNVLCLVFAGRNFLLKNASGFHVPAIR